MSEQQISILALAVTAAEAITARRFIQVAGTQAGAGENALGVARSEAATGEVVPTVVLGTAVVEAGAAVSLGDLIEADANGRGITRTAGAILGRALQAAGAAGEFIEVLLIPN